MEKFIIFFAILKLKTFILSLPFALFNISTMKFLEDKPFKSSLN